MHGQQNIKKLALSYFSTLSNKRQNFPKKSLHIKVCFESLYNVCLKRFYFKKNSTRYHNLRTSAREVTVIIVGF